MEELQKTQEYAAERERRRAQQPFEGQERRKSAPGAESSDKAEKLPVSPQDGTRRG